MTKQPWNKNKSIGQKIKELRERLKFTQKEFGQLIDVSAKRIGELENKTKNPSAMLLNRIAKAFSVSINYFLDDEQTVSDVQEDILIAHYRRLGEKEKKLAIKLIDLLVDISD